MTHLSEEELTDQLKKAHDAVKVGESYVHYRDPESRYIVTGLAIIEATQSI